MSFLLEAISHYTLYIILLDKLRMSSEKSTLEEKENLTNKAEQLALSNVYSNKNDSQFQHCKKMIYNNHMHGNGHSL